MAAAARGGDETVRPFTDFIGIDWSGASASGYGGISVAHCRAGGEAPALIPPTGGGSWTRQQVHDWLSGLLDQPGGPDRRRWLVGIDCAFSLPWAGTGGWFGQDGWADVFSLWDLVESACQADADFLGSGFALDPRYRRSFRHAGVDNPDFADLHRRAELACAVAGLGQPQSPYRLVGARQVGKAGLAGMRMLRSLRQRFGAGRDDAGIAIWPFERHRAGRADMVLAEIYPRLFLRRAGFGNRKIRDRGELDRALAALASQGAGQTGPIGDHDSDALVSAAGLRLIAGEARTWTPGLTEHDIRREGWIIGVVSSPDPA